MQTIISLLLIPTILVIGLSTEVLIAKLRRIKMQKWLGPPGTVNARPSQKFYLYEHASDTRWKFVGEMEAATAGSACEFWLTETFGTFQQIVSDASREIRFIGVSKAAIGQLNDIIEHDAISPSFLHLYHGW